MQLLNLFCFLVPATKLYRDAKPNNISAGADRSKHPRPPEAGERVCLRTVTLGVAGRTRGHEGGIETRRQFDRSRSSVTAHGSMTGPVLQTTDRVQSCLDRARESVLLTLG